MAERILIDAPHLLDVVDGRWLADRRVLVAGDRIEAILGPGDAAPDDARPLAIDGDWVVPGLIDCHAHLVGEMEYAGIPAIDVSPAQEAMSGVRNARDTLRAGFTSVRDVGKFRAFVDVALRDAIDAGWTPGPRMQCAGALHQMPRRRRRGQRRCARDRASRTGSASGSSRRGRGPHQGPDADRGRRRPDQVHRHRCRDDPRDGPGRRRAVGGQVRAAVEEAAAHGGTSRRTRTAPRGSSSRSGPASTRSSTRSLIDDEGIAMLAEHGTYLVADVYDGDWINEAGARDGWPAETMAKNVQTTEAQRAAFGKGVAAGVRIAYGTDSGVYPHPMVASQLGYQVRLGQTPLRGAALGDAHRRRADGLGGPRRVAAAGALRGPRGGALGPARRHRRDAPAGDRRQGWRPGRLRRRPGRGVVDRPCRSGPFVALASGRSSAGPTSARDETPVSEVVMPAASDERSRPNVRTAPDALAE